MSSFYKKVLVSLLSLVAIVFAYKALAVGYTPPPSIYYFGASPSTIMQSGSSTISWNAVNAYTCYGSGGWSGLKSAPSGSYTVAPNSTTTYILNCSNEVGASTSRTLTINVTPRNISTSNTCSCYNTGTQCSITDTGTGCGVVETTGTGVSYCQPGTLVGYDPNNPNSISPYCTPAPTVTFTANGSSTVTISAKQPTDPATSSNTANLSWAGTNSTSCSGAGGSGTSSTATTLSGVGSYSNSMLGTYPIRETCTGPGGSSFADVTINVTTAPQTGTCGSSNGGNFYTAPTTNLCSNGTASVVTGTGPWNWSCTTSGGSASCSANKKVDGACSSPATHYTCSAGTSTNNVNGATAWTWDCAGINGGTTAYGCSESKTSGTLSCSPCTITSGSSCTTSISWNTVNPVGTSSVTSPYPNANTVVGTGNYGYNTVTVPYDHRSFYLYNNSQQLDTCTSTASIACAAGTVWNGSGCVTAPTGQLTPVTNGCSIQSGQSSCTIPVSWSTTNPIGTSSVTSDVDNTGASSPNFTVTTGNSGSYVNFTIPYLNGQARNFYLYNSGQKLDAKSATASCVNGTSWDVGTGTCKTASPTAPTGVTATAVSSSQINTSWSPSTGGNGSQIAYNIYRCQGAGCTPNQYIGWGYTTNFSDTGLSSNTTYGYRILAYDSRPVFSSYSSSAYATTQPGVPVVTFTATPASISYGGTSILDWSVTDATSCTAGGGWSGAKATSGTQGVGPLYATTTFTLTCTGPGGNGSGTTSVAVGTAPTGTVSASTCSIALGFSTCSSSVSWNVSNPITGAQTAVTKDNPNGTVPNSNTTSGTKWVPVNYGTTNFALWHNGAGLASTSVNAQCSQGALIGGVCALVPVNGSCSSPASHYTCASGTSTNNVNGLTAWTWNCNGSNGGSNASCSETKGSGSLMSGTLSAPSCAILAGANSCNTTMTWNTVNPIGISAVTSSYPSANTVVASGNSGSQSVTIPYNSRNFYLYNSAGPFDPPLASVTPSATCTAGTTWSLTNNRCEKNIPSPTATITANPTSVVKGSSSTISWSSTNANSCTGTTSTGINFNPSNAKSGQVTVTPNNTTTYSLVCTGIATQASDQATVTVTVNPKKPKYIEQ